MPPRPAQAVALFYGNQALSVDRAAQAHTARVLGDEPSDFAFQRFDAEELLRGGSAEQQAERIAAFSAACSTLPFLCSEYVVRLEHLEVVKQSERAAQTLRGKLADLRLTATTWEGEQAWCLAGELPEDAPPGKTGTLEPFVEDVRTAGDGRVLVLLRDLPGAFLLRRRGEWRSVGVKEALRAWVKGSYAFADEVEADAAPSGGNAAGRLYRVLEALMASPPPGLHLVLTARVSRESELSRPLLALAQKQGLVQKFITYDDYNPRDWVQGEAKALGFAVPRDAAELLVHLVGNQQERLLAALQKLALMVPEGAAASEDVVLNTVHGDARGSLFLVNDRLGERDLPGALSILDQFFSESPNEFPILVGVLARHFRQLLLVHDLGRQNVPEPQWPAALKLPPFLARKLIVQAHHFHPAELEGVLSALAALDRDARISSSLTPLRFRDLALRLCTGGYRPAGHPARHPGRPPGGHAHPAPRGRP